MPENETVYFMVGDRVVVAKEMYYFGSQGPHVGDVGTVRAFAGKDIGVDFDNPVSDGHDLGGHCERGYGWWCLAKCLAHCIPDADGEEEQFDSATNEEISTFLFG